MGFGGTGCHFEFFLRGIRFSPAKVFGDGSRKEFVLLQHHSDTGMEFAQVIVLYRDAVNAYFSGADIIEAGDQLHE